MVPDRLTTGVNKQLTSRNMYETPWLSRIGTNIDSHVHLFFNSALEYLNLELILYGSSNFIAEIDSRAKKS